MSKRNKRKRYHNTGYERLKQMVETHYDDGLKLHQLIYPVFRSETYLATYRLQEKNMQAMGLDAIQRNYLHTQARLDIIKELQANPQKYG